MLLALRSQVRRAGLSLRRLLRDEAANVAIIFALAIPALFGAVGIAVDYSRAAALRTRMQSVADAAALNSVREFQVARATADQVAASARSYVMSQLADVAIATAVDDQALIVQVVLEKDVDMTIGKVIWGGRMHLRASATAKVNAKIPLCLLALDDRAAATVSLEKMAQVTAPGCMIYSDSRSNSGLQAKNDSVLTAGLICSVGGKVKSAHAKVTPEPVVDCPRMEDPLAARVPPPVGPCSFTDTVVSGGSQLLQPGVYCNGLRITDGAVVTLARGTYVVKDGPLVVDKGATMQGIDVGIYLKGRGANLTFAAASTISLSAPKDGPLAGLLIFDDPSGVGAPANPPYALPDTGTWVPLKGPPREHKILSDNARTLLGTIYMPQGRLIIDATKPIADKSAYTVLVVRRIDLHEGPNLYLNSDYSATDVPVPHGVGPYGKVLLTN